MDSRFDVNTQEWFRVDSIPFPVGPEDAWTPIGGKSVFATAQEALRVFESCDNLDHRYRIVKVEETLLVLK